LRGNIEAMLEWKSAGQLIATLAERLKRSTEYVPAQPRSALTPSAVLVPIAAFDGPPRLVFVQRSEKTRYHKGQMGFPGGVVEREDPDFLSAALREAHEEVGIPRESVEVLGALTPTETVTGFLIYPFVGVLKERVEFQKDAREIHEIFLVPVEEFTRGPDSAVEFWLGGKGFLVSAFFLDDIVIWGATARIILSLFKDGLGFDLLNRGAANG